jgi:hypothetical protein
MARVEVPNPSDVAERWSSGASGAASRYQSNAAAAADKFQTQASSDQAQDNFETQMQDPNVLQRRQDNLGEAARQRYSDRVQAYGSTRYSQGINESGQAFQQAIGEVLSAIDGLQIPERGTAMSQANLDRAEQVQRALHEAGQGV